MVGADVRAAAGYAVPLRVWSGVDDVAGQYPFVVALLLMYMRKCTGSLITSTWVLTAAHCHVVDAIQYGNMTVTPRLIETDRKILKMIPHDGYKVIQTTEKTIYNDIALVLVEEVPLKVFGKLSGLDFRAIMGNEVNYAGLGATEENRAVSGVLKDLMRPLQLAEGVVVSCASMYNLATPCICVAPRCSAPQSVLPGDSGGPLFHDGKIVGVAHSLQDLHISLFMPVSPFLTWVHQVMTREQTLIITNTK